jgi:hypothetical protein
MTAIEQDFQERREKASLSYRRTDIGVHQVSTVLVALFLISELYQQLVKQVSRLNFGDNAKNRSLRLHLGFFQVHWEISRTQYIQ